jgi:glycosyltransferase involved in cell wall biosynthesis
MKALHVIPSLSFAHGGPSHAIRLTERALRMQGVEIETATTDDDGPGARNGKRCGVPLTEHGVTRRYFRKRLEFYKASPGFARWIYAQVQDYDVVHIHALFSFTSVAAAWAARGAGVPYVVRPLGTLNRYGVKKRRPWLKRLSLKFIEGPILRHAAAVHFTAEAEKAEAENLGIPMRSVVVPLGIDPAPQGDPSVFLERFPELNNCRLLLFLSRLDPKKNVEGLLQAFRLCNSTLPDTNLVIAGNGEADYVAGLKMLAAELGLAGRVVWTGYVEGELKAGALAAADAFVLPSFSENFGIAVVEAMLAGLPCVLGKGVALADEVAQAGAGLATSPEPEAIARALQDVFADENRRAEMGLRAVALAREQYSLEAMGERLVRLYERIVNGEQ